MKTYIAKQNERFDTLFIRFYGKFYQNDYENGYNAFILANIHLIDKGVFEGGEIIYIP